MSIVVKVQWWHIVVEVSLVADVVSIVRARTALVFFESKAWKPKAETKTGLKSQKSEKDRESLCSLISTATKSKATFCILEADESKCTDAIWTAHLNNH